MQHLNSCLFGLLSALLLIGCGSNSDSKTTDKLTQPKPDFSFTQSNLDDILDERKSITEAISLQINNKSYNTLRFTHFDENFSLFKLESANKDSLILMLPDGKKDNNTCIIYRSKTDMEAFNCSKEKFTNNGDSSILQQEPSNKFNVISIEYQNELFEVGDSLGSTELTFHSKVTGDEVLTSFAFDSFYQNIFCNGQCDEKIYSTLGASTYLALEDLTNAYALNGATLIFNNPIGGSADDEINLYTGILMRDSGLNTKVSKNGSVFSGGTDLFAAGVKRTLEVMDPNKAIEQNQQIGVHSWSDGEKSAKDYPFTHEMHRMQATFTTKMLGDKGIPFYLFTLDAAPAEGEHFMTRQELEKYNLVTHIIE